MCVRKRVRRRIDSKKKTTSKAIETTPFEIIIKTVTAPEHQGREGELGVARRQRAKLTDHTCTPVRKQQRA